jgi:hypothetical protein
VASVARQWSSAVLTILILGCGLFDSVTEPDSNQTWEFTLLNDQGGVEARSTGECLPGGACGPFDWAGDEGCTLVYRFEVQFSGDQVRILLGKIGPGTTCQGITIGQNLGTGYADTAYPEATAASGTVTIYWNLPGLGSVGGPANWTARRVG